MNTIVEHINSAGFSFTEFALPMLVQSCVLIVILLLVDLLLRKKVKAVFRYWIWMLVLLKLVLPTSLSSPLSLGYFFGDKLTYQDLAETTSALELAEPLPAEISPDINPIYIQPNPYVPPSVSVTSVVEPVVVEPVSPPPVPVTPLSWQGVVFLTWLAIVMAMGLLLLQRALFVRGLVAQAKKASRLMNDELAYCCASMGIKAKVSLKISVNATTPSVCGLIRPVILVPWNLVSTLGVSRMRTVLMHELAHIRRGDLWVNLAQTVLQIIFFYNPLLWLANCVVRRIREQAVDEAVLVAMGEGAQQYPQTLVDVAKMAFKRPALSLRLIGVVESKSALAGRIKHILSRPIPKSARLGLISILAIIIAGAILLPMAMAQRLELAGRGGPLNIRLAGVRPDGGDDIYDASGNKIAENTFADIADRWGEDKQNRTFIFELPKTGGPILFSPFLNIKPTGAKRGFGTGQHPLLYYSGDKLIYTVGMNFPRTYKKVFERRVKKVDLTLRYYYGQRGAADFVFNGPFVAGQTVKAEGGQDCQLTPKEDKLNFGNHPAAFFRISSETRFDGDSVLIYDTSGRRYLLAIAGGRSGSGGTYYNYRAEGLTLNSIAYVTVGEKPYEAAFKNVVVSYPDRPALDRMEFLDEMCRRLELTGLSSEDLDDYKFESPADAIKIIDIVRGEWYVRKVFDAIRYSDPRIELSSLDAQTQQKIRSAAARWAKAGHPKVRAMGIRLGLMGGWPEFMELAMDWLEQDVIVYDMLGRTYRGLEEKAKGQVAREAASYSAGLNSKQAERIKRIILRTDSPRIGVQLFRLFWRADKDITYEICRDLAQDDRPWIWWHAMRLFFNRFNEKLRPFENLSEKIQKRLILVHKARGGSSRLFDVSSSGKDYETVAKEAYSMLPGMFTARLARMDSSICHNVRQLMAKHLDREIAAKAMTNFLREISTESNQRLWVGDSPYFGTCCSTAYCIARHINSLYDVNIQNLGKYETREDSEAIPNHISQLKQLVAKTLQWYDDRSGAGSESGVAWEIGVSNEAGHTPFTATLLNGVTVELSGLTYIPADDQPWWKPDGSPMDSLFDRADYDPGKDKDKDQYSYYAAAVRIDGLPPEEVFSPKMKWHAEVAEHTDNISIFKGGENLRGGNLYAAAIKRISKDAQSTDLQLGLAVGEWETIAKGRHMGFYEIGDDTVILREPFEGLGGIRPWDKGWPLGVTYTITDRDFRIAILDEDGQLHPGKRRGGGGTSSLRRMEITFPDLEPKQEKFFLIQTRPYEWVEFKNVSLRPGMKTDVEIEVEKTASNNSGGDSKRLQHITFKEGMFIRQALRFLGKAYKKNIILSDKVAGQVPVIELYNVTFEETLQAILGTHKYIIDGDFIRVYTEEEFESFYPEEKTNSQVEIEKSAVQVEVEKTISLKLVMLLDAINSCAAETDLNVDSISIKGNNISIKGNTSGRANSRKFLDAIEQNELKISQMSLLDAKGNRDKFSIVVEPEKDWQYWWRQRKTDVQLGVEETVSPKLVMLLTAINSCASETKLNIESISVTAKSMSIEGDTSRRTDTLKFLDTIKDNGLDVSRLNLDERNNRDRFRMDVKPKENWRQWWQKHKTDVPFGTERPVVGGWEDVGNPIPADFNDTIPLTEQIDLGSIGRDVEGKSFITFVWDKEKDRKRQYRFVLIKNNDTVLEPDSHLILDENGRLEEKFTFDEPYISWRSVEFKFQSRPLPLVGTRSISSQLQKDTSTAFDGKTISSSKLAPPGRYAIELDGDDDYLLVPDSPTLRLEPPFTVEMWVKPKLPEKKPEHLQEWGVIAKGGYVGTGRVKPRGFGIEFTRFEKEPATFNISYTEANDKGLFGQDYGSYRFDEWMHISHVFEGENYKPGNGHPLVVGRFLIPMPEPFMGQIGEIRIWNGARKREEIRRYRDVALTGKEPGLAACWNFEQAEGQFAYDMSGNNNHGRLGRFIEPDGADPEWIDLEAASRQPGQIADMSAEDEREKDTSAGKHIEFLGLDLTDAPRTTKSTDLSDLFEARPPGSKSYHIRKDVTAVYSGLYGTVYYIPEKEIFYVQHDKMGSSTRTYYGPFNGDPHQVLGLEKDVPVEAEEARAVSGESEVRLAASGDGPRIKFESLVCDLGQIPSKTKHVCEFKFTNTGNEVLEITKVRSTCGCIISKLTKKQFAPGESETLQATYQSSARTEKVKKYVFVYSNDEANPEVILTVKAEILIKVAHEPKRFNLVLDKENAGCPAIKLTSIDNQPFSITDFKSTGDSIMADFDPSVKETSFVLKPMVDMEKLEKGMKGRIEISLNHPECKKLTITYDTLAEFKTDPRVIYVREAEPLKSVTKTVRVLSNYNEDVEIESTSSKKGTVKVLTQEKIQNGYQFELEITPPVQESKRRVFTDKFSVVLKGGQLLQMTCYGIYSKKPAETAEKSTSNTDVEVESEQSDEDSEAANSELTVPGPVETRGRISGVIVHSATGEPIVGAYVGVGDFGDSGGSNYSRHRSQGFHDKTKTDAEGRFELNGLVFTDKHRDLEYHPLVVTHPDFVRHDEKIELLSGGPVPDVKVSLRPAATIDVTIEDADGNPLQGQWLIRLEALDGRRFIPPGSDPHLSSFASSVWIERPKPVPAKKSLSGTTGFSFTELDRGQYSIDVMEFAITDNYTPPPPGMVRLPLDTSKVSYYGGMANVKIEAGRTKEVRIKPAEYQTSVSINMPQDPIKKQQIPPFVIISRNTGLLLWNDGKAHGPEDHRLGRLQKNALYYNLVVDADVFTIQNLPPGSYSVFAGPIYFMSATRMEVSRGREVVVDMPPIQITEHAKVGLWTFDRKVKLQARDYSVSELCEILTEITKSNPRLIAESSIENEKLRFGRGEMSVWDVLEKLYLDKGWIVDEGQDKTLVLKPGTKTDMQGDLEKKGEGSGLIWGEKVNGVRARIWSKAPYVLYGNKPNIFLEVDNQSTQKMQIAYPPKYLKEDAGWWRGLGKIEIVDPNGKVIQPMWSFRKPYLHPVGLNSKYRGPAELDTYGFDFAEPGRYKVRVTFGVQPLENGKSFRVSTNWLEFDAVLTEHVAGAPYTAKQALEEARAYTQILHSHQKISKRQAIDKFLTIARDYPDSQYEMKAYFWAANLAWNPSNPNVSVEEEYKEQTKMYWRKIVGKWPELVLHEAVAARFNLAAGDENQFEKLLDFYKWLTSRTEKQKIASVTKWADYFGGPKSVAEKLKYLDRSLAIPLDTLQRNLTTSSKSPVQLTTIIERFPGTNLAELARKELNKKNHLAETQIDVLVEGEGVGKNTNKEMQPLSFGPVVNCVVHAIDAEKDSFIDFDNGKYFNTPKKRWLLFDFDVRNLHHRVEWAKKTGADATVRYSSGGGGDLVMLWCYDVAAKKVESDSWQDLRAEQVVQYLSKATHFVEDDLGFGHLRQNPPDATRIFKTREGGVGIIQIVGFTKNPMGVKIQYKMVQKEPAGNTNVQVGGLKATS
ncbi:MAG: M56 family metallopeptidase [Planctomycetota bacterium]|jgi:beta-lactamase regulating signal transducer with metallopeptidase domain